MSSFVFGQAQPAFDQLLREHHALLQLYGAAQLRCSDLLNEHQQQLDALQHELMNLRAQAMLRLTAQLWAQQEQQRQAAPVCHQCRPQAEAGVRQAACQQQRTSKNPISAQERAALEATLAAADLVICQTGCISHGDFWRVEDYCKRTGKLCVLADQAQDLLRIVRIRDLDSFEQRHVAL